MSGNYILDALARQSGQEALVEGLKAAVRLFYEEYEDATALDPEVYGAIVALSELTDADPDDLVDEVERAIHDEDGSDFDSLEGDTDEES